jgi:hypothetical protein
MPDGGGRLLKLREGHNKPPTKIRFYGSLGTSIISAGNIFFRYNIILLIKPHPGPSWTSPVLLDHLHLPLS